MHFEKKKKKKSIHWSEAPLLLFSLLPQSSTDNRNWEINCTSEHFTTDVCVHAQTYVYYMCVLHTGLQIHKLIERELYKDIQTQILLTLVLGNFGEVSLLH